MKTLKRWFVAGILALMVLWAFNFVGGGTAPQSSPPKGATAVSASSQSNSSTTKAKTVNTTSDSLLRYKSQLDQELATSLQAIKGAGHVKVQVDLVSGPTMHWATDTTTNTTVTQAKDSQGGTQVTHTTNNTSKIVLNQSNTAGQPILKNEQGPTIIGALVVAQGAQNPTVARELLRATQTLLGLPAYKITVLPEGGTAS